MNTREDILKNDLIDFIKENNIDINNNKNSEIVDKMGGWNVGQNGWLS